MINYTTIDHTADLGIQVFGADIKDLFSNAGLAMCDLIADTNHRHGLKTYRVSAKGHDWPDLMVAWLRELLYLWAGKERLVRTIDIESISPYIVSARVRCIRFDAGRHSIKHDIKAVTYHQIRVDQTRNGWESVIIFDV
jgi:SHS2 domain-containing protein